MDNLEFYDKYKSVPNNALKSFDNGKFKGTDINTMWRIKSLTETFGMCGFGWYFNIKDKWLEKIETGDVFAFVEIELFVKVNDEWSKPITGTGGNKLARLTKDGNISTSDEAYKMAVTDALGVACRSLGMGADVYWANDKTKYTEHNEVKVVKTKMFTFDSGRYKGLTMAQASEKEDFTEYVELLKSTNNWSKEMQDAFEKTNKFLNLTGEMKEKTL